MGIRKLSLIDLLFKYYSFSNMNCFLLGVVSYPELDKSLLKISNYFNSIFIYNIAFTYQQYNE